MKNLLAASQSILLPIIGVLIIIKPVHHGYKFSYDLRGGLEWILGISFILLGFFFFIAQLKQSTGNGKNMMNFPVICPKCQELFNHKRKLHNMKCPRCNIDVESLKGFYKRHPDL